MEYAIEITGLKKAYGGRPVLNGVTLAVREGETFALLGVNGAGKTTTLESLEGIRKPDGGTIKVLGRDIRQNERMLRKALGVQLQSTSLPDSITPVEAMKLFCAWQGKPCRGDLLERYGMGEYMKTQYSALSAGRKRRLHLALALCHDPKALILDEPTAGLDVEGRRLLHDEIRKLKRDGISILLATHDMDEAESLCDRIAFMRGGEIVKIGTPLELTAEASAKSHVVLKTSREIDGALLPGGYERMDDGYVSFASADVLSTMYDLLGKIRDTGNELLDLRVERASLEDIFVGIAGGAS